MIQKTDEGIKAFANHGFRERTQVGNQVVGDCPLCLKESHFYINSETKQWDCKKCGRAGGFQTFLQQILDVCLDAPDRGDRLKVLGENRGLKPETFLDFDVCYNSASSEYLIPVYHYVGDERQVWDIRRGRLGKGLRSTAGCSLGVLNWELIPDMDRLWLCEGEWDAMACHELLRSLGMSTDLALGLPGAGTLKDNWGAMFTNRQMVAVYDADKAGRAGALKAYNRLHKLAESLLFVDWGPDVADGYDLRDGYRDHGKALFDRMMSACSAYPPGSDQTKLHVKSEERFTGEGVDPEDVYATYKKWLYMPDTILIDVIFGTVVANRQPGDPIWMFIVAPPGGTKTEPLSSLTEASEIVYKNTLGSKSLVSGQMTSGGADPSLLPRLHEKILVIEDFTTVLSIQPTYREEIFGILRSAYNGRYERDYGNGRIFRCDCQFGILAGVTPAIEHHNETFAALGERFLHYAPPIPTDIKGRRPYLKKAQDNRGRELEMRTELKTIAAAALNHSFNVAPVFSDAIEDQILDLAQWTSMMRGVLKRDKYGASKEITHAPYAELGTRLVKQFTKLVDGIGRFKHVEAITANEYLVASRIAYGTVPGDRRAFLEAMWNDPEHSWTTGDIADLSGLPRYPMCERVAETLSMLGVLKRDRKLNRQTWRIDDDFIEVTDSTQIFNRR